MLGKWIIDNNYFVHFEPIHLQLGEKTGSLITSSREVDPIDDPKYKGEVIYNTHTEMYEIICEDTNFAKDYKAIDAIFDTFKLNYLRCDILTQSKV